MFTPQNTSHIPRLDRLEAENAQLRRANNDLRTARADLISEVIRLRRALYYADRLRLHAALRAAA